VKKLQATVVLLLAWVWCSAPALSQTAGQSGAADVTVRLFFSQNVDALTITPASTSVTVKRCRGCAAQPLRSPLHARDKGARLVLDDLKESPARNLEISGALRVETDSGRVAAAAGKWHLESDRDGLHLTLTLPSERYVMAVLASEASPEEPASSLQALAIVIRSFALTHLNRHAAEGFDLCDSTHCQALKLIPVSDSLRRAVEQTAGETIWMHGQRATAYFTQNCGGVTEDAAQIWGGAPRSWLITHPDPYCQRTSAAWHASLSQAELQQSLAVAGWPIHTSISAVRIVRRDASGRATTLQIVTDKQQININASTFRFAVGRSLGWNRLRSDWYAVHFANGVAQFDGKGFGHGVGLCQAGAAAMASTQGVDARTILRFYFPGTDVRVSTSDQGWHEAHGDGWTLFGTAPAEFARILREGDVAWSRARALLDAGDTVHVTVQVFPSTDLFRASTGEPGWVIGSTRGEAISLQPLRLIESREPLQDALFHEMLHAFVEHEATSATPLWLREGLVEALASRASSASEQQTPKMSVEQIDAALMRSSSLDEARRAHQAAAEDVRRLFSGYGVSVVRGWLRSGVPREALAKTGLR